MHATGAPEPPAGVPSMKDAKPKPDVAPAVFGLCPCVKPLLKLNDIPAAPCVLFA